ncbi:hypothetical protein ACNJYD_04380 [Bradyrhizobium sp. DASA03005]|uniref:hypothetical protein n=1 Tax=Bradyrhizobium sp. SPXBL-02 TaxID=3395912 RepID=UPI003F71ABF1
MLNANLLAQERSRLEAISTLQRLRREARDEISRLIQFLDQSDPYVMTELEDGADDGPCDTDELEQDLATPDPRTSGDYLGRSPWTMRTFDQSRFQGEDIEADDSDDEPSLGAIEKHASCYGVDGRNSSGDQTAWADSGTKDLEDEHDGAEPGDDDEPSLGALEGHTDQRAAWHAASVNDYELDHSESGIGDLDGALEQVGTQDWQQGTMG